MRSLSFRIPFRITGPCTDSLRIESTQHWPDRPGKPVLANWYGEDELVDESSFGVRSDLFFTPEGSRTAISALVEHGMARSTARHIWQGMRRLVRKQLGGAGYVLGEA